ncbi:MAG: hypothetical protein HZC26_04075 [Candidatus Magasanikbacteria bacterium]|nr:hypothetical protein [Candidatus Magasanikbacteria bacterium]MBI5412935.1 hypothetical protein [Candidatus Peregrinibacteria bacterium]
MIGVLLIIIGGFFQELFDSLGKMKVSQLKQSTYTMGFLGFFWTTIFFLLIIIIKGKFGFSAASLPFFLTRLFLEVILAHFTVLAVTKADRSTFGFVRVITLPLLLLVDIFLGYNISYFQIIGISLISMVIMFFFLDGKNNKKGGGIVLFTAVTAVITLSLFKYNITHFNAVEAEQFLTHLTLLIYFFFSALFFARENPLRFLFKPACFVQSVSQGLASLLYSFGMDFISPSVFAAVKRSSSIILSAASGFFCFHEKNWLAKLAFLTGLIIGVILLLF